MKADRLLSGMFLFLGVVGIIPLILVLVFMAQDFSFGTVIFLLLGAGVILSCMYFHEHYEAKVVLQQSREREASEERARREWWERHEKANREWLEKQARQSAQAAGVAARSDMHISGSPQFVKTVHAVLDELSGKLPHRYQEVIHFLPRAVFNPDLRSYTQPGKKVAGRSDGYFSVDGSGHRYHGDGWYIKNDYKHFRGVFLHEVGHNVAGKKKKDWSEEAANTYANEVTRELGT